MSSPARIFFSLPFYLSFPVLPSLLLTPLAGSPKCILLPGQHANPRQERCPIEANPAKNRIQSRHVFFALPYPLSRFYLPPCSPPSLKLRGMEEDEVEESRSRQKSDPTPAKRSPCTSLMSYSFHHHYYHYYYLHPDGRMEVMKKVWFTRDIA